MKDAIIAKLANQAADFYGDAFKQCQYKENLPKVREGRTELPTKLPTVSHVLSVIRMSGFCMFWCVSVFLTGLDLTCDCGV